MPPWRGTGYLCQLYSGTLFLGVKSTHILQEDVDGFEQMRPPRWLQFDRRMVRFIVCFRTSPRRSNRLFSLRRVVPKPNWTEKQHRYTKLVTVEVTLPSLAVEPNHVPISKKLLALLLPKPSNTYGLTTRNPLNKPSSSLIAMRFPHICSPSPNMWGGLHPWPPFLLPSLTPSSVSPSPKSTSSVSISKSP